VEDDGRLVAVEDLTQPLRAPDVGDHRHPGREVAVVDELALDLVEGRLGLVDEDQPRCACSGRQNHKAPPLPPPAPARNPLGWKSTPHIVPWKFVAGRTMTATA